MSIRWIALIGFLAAANGLHAANVRYVGEGAASIVPADAALVFTRQVFVPDPSQAHHGVTIVLAPSVRRSWET